MEKDFKEEIKKVLDKKYPELDIIDIQDRAIRNMKLECIDYIENKFNFYKYMPHELNAAIYDLKRTDKGSLELIGRFRRY